MCLSESSAKGSATVMPFSIKIMSAAISGGFLEETGRLEYMFYINLNTIEFDSDFNPKVEELTD